LTGEQKIEAQASDKDSLYNITPNWIIVSLGFFSA